MRRGGFVCGLFAWWLVGCGGGESPPTEQPPVNNDPVIDPENCDDPSKLCLAEPERGFQIRSVGATIEPGEDIEYCEVVLLPGTASDTHYVHRFETQMTLGSHHLIVAGIEPGTATDAAAKVGDRVLCTGPDIFGGELIPVTGAQQPYHSEDFPEGVGRVYKGGQKVVFDYHYFNTTQQPIQAQAAVNFHTVDASEIEKISEVFGFYNLGIQIPAMSTAAFEKECVFNHDIMVHKLTRHTHKWGTDFKAWYLGGAHDGEEIFTSPDYESVDFPFEEPVLMHAGEGFRFSCSYNNTTDGMLTFGLKATDEMCILFGSWFVVNEGDAVMSQSCYLF